MISARPGRAASLASGGRDGSLDPCRLANHASYRAQQAYCPAYMANRAPVRALLAPYFAASRAPIRALLAPLFATRNADFLSLGSPRDPSFFSLGATRPTAVLSFSTFATRALLGIARDEFLDDLHKVLLGCSRVAKKRRPVVDVMSEQARRAARRRKCACCVRASSARERWREFRGGGERRPMASPSDLPKETMRIGSRGGRA